MYVELNNTKQIEEKEIDQQRTLYSNFVFNTPPPPPPPPQKKVKGLTA